MSGYDYLPHTDADRRQMLETLGLESLDDLFEPIPPALRSRGLAREDVPGPASEPEVLSILRDLADANTAARLVCFAGGGAYDEYVPASVAEIANRPEFKTSYTPYQPEVSQGVLQALFEYQSMVCRLFGMDVANASVYDGASAVVEAANMAVRITGKEAIAVSKGLNPRYRAVLKTVASGRGHRIVEIGLDSFRTIPDIERVESDEGIKAGLAGVIFQHPNYFGILERVDELVRSAHESGALAVAVVDPISCGLLKRPGDYGADIVVAEGQPLGNRLNFGGPYLGVLATREQYLRDLPGRIAGMTVDADGKRCFALALQGREQHIRREKAASNICTNQTLNAIAAAAYMAWLGPRGLRKVAEDCCRKAHYLATQLAAIPGFRLLTDASFFREFPISVPLGAQEFLRQMAGEGFLAGVPLDDAVEPYGNGSGDRKWLGYSNELGAKDGRGHRAGNRAAEARGAGEGGEEKLSNAVLIAVASRRTMRDVEAFIRAAQRVGK